MLITLYGMWKYNPALFDDIDIDARLKKNLLITYIMQFAGGNEVRYPEPTILKMCIDSFFEAHKNNYSRMLDALLAEYSPIENYDRMEDRTLDVIKDNKVTRNGEDASTDNNTVNSSSTNSGTKSDNVTVNSENNGTDEKQTSAFNATTYQPLDKNITNENGTSTTVNTGETSTTNKSDGTSSSKHNGTFSNNEVGNETQGHKEKLRAHGNIGVTTNQQMIQEEIELRKLNIYELIALAFEDEITITVY